jgi:hypothetical protein
MFSTTIKIPHSLKIIKRTLGLINLQKYKNDEHSQKNPILPKASLPRQISQTQWLIWFLTNKEALIE